MAEEPETSNSSEASSATQDTITQLSNTSYESGVAVLPRWLRGIDFAQEFSDKQDRLLRFTDRRLEVNYASELNESCRRTCRIVFLFGAAFCFLELLLTGAPWRLTHPDFAAAGTAWARVALCLDLFFFGVLTFFRRFTGEAVTTMVCFTGTFLLMFTSTVRSSRASGSRYHLHAFQNCGSVSCYDDSQFVLVLTIITTLTPTLIGIRLVQLMCIQLWGVILYFGTCPCGPMPIVDHMSVGLIYMSFCGIQCLGHARWENEGRRRWLENLRLKMSVFIMHKDLLAVLARRCDVEEQLESLEFAFSTPASVFKVGIVKEGDEDSVLPGRTVPTPQQVASRFLSKSSSHRRRSVTSNASSAPMKIGCSMQSSRSDASSAPARARLAWKTGGALPKLAEQKLAAPADDVAENLPPMRTLERPEHEPHIDQPCYSIAHKYFAVVDGCPNPLLACLAAKRQANPVRLRSIAEQIRSPEYSLKSFFEDCIATFPELDYFFEANPNRLTSSGNNNGVEYQRTIGALFAVYWLLRLDMDGKEGFSFGYSSQWHVKSRSRHVKRTRFFEDVSWYDFEDVVTSALGTSIERLEAMLCLTAFHDLMKVSEFCPTVGAEHAPFHGYLEGEVITDHDLAIAYILMHYPDMLPSFRILPPASREVVLFTQGKMHFNHGWFVQAEATPGHVLSSLKSTLIQANPGDFAFYFLHWITDLSGAEGQPLAGAEKFVMRFPQSVLASFLWSIPYLQHLHTQTETEVMEAYLVARFESALPNVQAPTDYDGIALMRLVVMAQSGAQHVLTTWTMLAPDDFQVLVEELSLTGIEGQRYGRCAALGHPAFFVYYGPALLQCCSSAAEMATALAILASVYRAGRRLWPFSSSATGGTIMLEIGSMKPKFIELLQNSGNPGNSVWILSRRSEMEAGVILAGGQELNAFITQQAPFTVLDMDGPQKRQSTILTEGCWHRRSPCISEAFSV